MDTRSILTVDNLAYRYPEPAGNRGLDLQALDVHPGQLVLLAGPSGCGKSTLARCLAGLIPHLYHGELSGRVVVDGLDTTDTPLWQLSERAGMVFQNPRSQMLAATVEDEIVFGLENLGLARAEIHDRLESVLDRFGLQALRRRPPLKLSGGEQQRVAIARAFAKNPQILLCDEPTGALDFETGKQILHVLRDINERMAKTILLITHNASIGHIADRVIRLRSGRVIAVDVNEQKRSPEDIEW